MDKQLPPLEIVNVQTEELYEILDENDGIDENIYVLYEDDVENGEAETNELSEEQYEAEELEFLEEEEEEEEEIKTEKEKEQTTKQLTCDICDRVFSTIADRNKHIEEHFQQIQCPSCMRLFTGDRAYEFHISNGRCKETVDVDKFRCSLCNEKVFDSIEALNIHLRTKHNCFISENRIGCELCNRTFGKLKYLRKHVRELHQNATPFNCEICGKEFRRKSNLIEHELIHQNKYLAECKTCGKSYRTSTALRVHQRTHTGEKPYVCEICNEKAYAYNTDLKRHKRAMHGIIDGTPHPCTLCEKIFYEPKLLRNHLKSHKDSKTKLS